MTEQGKERRTRPLVTALVVVAVLVAGTLGLSYVMQPKNNSSDYGMIRPIANGFLGEPEDSIDVLFVGNSRVYHAISPLQMWHEQGFTSYDASTPGQNMAYANTLLSRAFTKHHPRVVVFETDEFYKEFAMGDAMLRLAADRLPLFEYHSRWKDLKLRDFTEPVRTTWTHSLKGFVVDEDAVAADAESYGDEMDELEAVPRNAQIYLRFMLDACRQQGSTPLFLSLPSTKNWDKSKHNGIQELADELGVEYVDLNDRWRQVGIDWDLDTSDAGEHLNYDGAVKVTRFIGSYLSSTYDLPDHRTDDEYRSWEESYRRYLRAIPSQKS